jgi:hypothetical protein
MGKRAPKTLQVKVGLLLDASEVESLAEEMTSWRDNMQGTNLENTSKFEEVNECADTLENGAYLLTAAIETLQAFLAGNLPAVLELEVTQTVPGKRRTGRSWRLSEAIGDIGQALEAIRNYVDEKGTGPGASEQLQPEKKQELEGTMGEVEDAISEVEGIDFPGMF